MTCPICDQKPMNCDCTQREREMYCELQERGDRPATPLLTDTERAALERVAAAYELLPGVGAKQVAETILGLLERCGCQQ